MNWLVLGQGTVALSSGVHASAQHPVEETLLGFPLVGQNLLAEFVKAVGGLLYVFGGRHLGELALKVLGQNLPLLFAYSSQVHHVNFVAHQTDHRV